MEHIQLAQNKYSVYIHIFPNGKVYIGITSQKPKERWRNGKGYYGSTRICNAIQKYGWKNTKHKILYEYLTKEEAENKEKELIQQYKSYDEKYGYNLELGGNLRKEISKETKRKLSIKLSGKNNPMYGKHISEENKKRMSERNKGRNNPMYGKSANKGKHLTEEQKQKLSKIMNSPEVHKKLSEASKGKNNAMFGVRLPEYILEKKRKKVLCIETNKIYNSLKEASEETNISITCLSETCNGKQKTSRGLHWKYL